MLPAPGYNVCCLYLLLKANAKTIIATINNKGQSSDPSNPKGPPVHVSEPDTDCCSRLVSFNPLTSYPKIGP